MKHPGVSIFDNTQKKNFKSNLVLLVLVPVLES